MNFREHFEQWHLKRYGYKAEGKGTALAYKYKQPTIQGRWEVWQACADWHSGQQMGVNSTHTLDNDEIVDILQDALKLVDAYRRIALGDGDLTAMNIRRVLKKLGGEE